MRAAWIRIDHTLKSGLRLPRGRASRPYERFTSDTPAIALLLTAVSHSPRSRQGGTDLRARHIDLPDLRQLLCSTSQRNGDHESIGDVLRDPNELIAIA